MATSVDNQFSGSRKSHIIPNSFQPPVMKLVGRESHQLLLFTQCHCQMLCSPYLMPQDLQLHILVASEWMALSNLLRMRGEGTTQGMEEDRVWNWALLRGSHV